MGSASPARPPSSLGSRGPRLTLVSVLAGAWLLFAALLVVGGVRALARPASTAFERALAAVFLVLATLFGTGAFGLLRGRSRARALLAFAGVAALALSAFGTYRLVRVASAPAVERAATEPDAANALVLFRATSAIGFLLGSIPLVLALAFLRHPTVREWTNPGAAAPRPRRRPDALVLVAGGALAVAVFSFLLSRKSPSLRAPAPRERVALAPAETFLWSDQGVTFRPPAAPFTRERHAEGGRKGVSFTRYAVPPTRITVAEAFLEPAPNTPEEAIARLRLTAESFRSADAADVGEPEASTVAGVPAFRTDYAVRERSMEHRGREIVALAGRHVFVFTFLGRETDVPLFEKLVVTAAFPAPGGPEGAVATAGARAGGGKGGADVPGTALHVGEHRVTVNVPDGWERVDYGQKQEFRRGEARIALVDGGPLPEGVGPSNLEDEWLVQRALRLFSHDPRRWEVGARTRLSAGPHEALAVDTRDPLSHAFHARTILFVNRGRLLAAGMVMGVPEANRVPLDALARSVRFPG